MVISDFCGIVKGSSRFLKVPYASFSFAMVSFWFAQVLSKFPGVSQSLSWSLWVSEVLYGSLRFSTLI